MALSHHNLSPKGGTFGRSSWFMFFAGSVALFFVANEYALLFIVPSLLFSKQEDPSALAPGNGNQLLRKNPRIYYSVLTLESALENHPERQQNVERIEKEFPQFVRDIAIDAVTGYEEINAIFQCHNATCNPDNNQMKFGSYGLWASTLRQWEKLIKERDQWDFAVIVQDDHTYDQEMNKKVTTMVNNRWKYYPGENSLPMYSFGHGDGINLYTVSALPMLVRAFEELFNKPHNQNVRALDNFYDSLGLATENMNFAWSKILKTHDNSMLNEIQAVTKFDVVCTSKGILERVEKLAQT